MPSSTMITPHQLHAATLEYRPPPRRNYHPGPVHAAMVPGMMDESGLGLLMPHIFLNNPVFTE